MRKKCVHCDQRVASRPRGLCFKCFYTPEIKQLYKPKINIDNSVGKKEPAKFDLPTCAAPGSEEKIAVLQYRAENSLKLWHPLDAKMDLS